MNKRLVINSSQEIVKDLAIIGAGPVGLFCAFEAGMLGMNSVVVDNLSIEGGQCNALYPQKPIYDIPGFPMIQAEQLIANLMKQCAPFNPKFIFSAQVDSIEKCPENHFILRLSDQQVIRAKAVVIAAGCGAFTPNRLPLDNAAAFEGKSLFYSVTDRAIFKDKTIAVAGGGDSALDWALDLAEIAKKVYLIHRRNNFRAMQNTLTQLESFQDAGKIELITPYQLHSLIGSDASGTLEKIELIDLDGNTKTLDVDYLLPFFGLKMDLGPILNWHLSLDGSHISVDPATMQTNTCGIFAIGDIATYPGKLKLILSGFAEAARACHSAYGYVFAGKQLHFQHSTTQGVPKGD